MASKVLRNFLSSVYLQEPEEIPIVIWGVAPWYSDKIGIKARDYYQSVELKLETQIKLQNRFPDTLLLPGIWPDFGISAETSAFGCPIVWPVENEAPMAKPAITDLQQVLYMKPINIKEAGLLPKVIENYEYLLRNVDKKFIDEYGYLNGTVFLLGPLETAALVRGYQAFLVELIDKPKLVHKFLDMVTCTLLEWLEYLDTKFGKINRLLLCDHFPTQISSNHFEEFFFPYIKKIFDEYPNAIKLYHNEGNIEHVASRIADMGSTIFHFGTEVKQTKEALGDKLCLMGNLDPIRLILNGNARLIKDETIKVLNIGARKGGFILSTAGGFSVDTPDENIFAMIETGRSFTMTK